MLLWQRETPSRRRGRFSYAPISSAPVSDARTTTVSCRLQSRTFLAGQSYFAGLLPRTVGKIVLPHGAGILPWYCHNNLYCFSFPASASSFPIAQQNQPIFIKMFKKQAKRKSRCPAPRVRFYLCIISACFFDVSV